MVVKLRYVDTGLTLNPDGIPPPTYIFRCNSIHDPNYTAGGHQPMYHDLYENMYKYYTVLGAKITVKFANANGNNYLVGLIKSDSLSTSVSSEALGENKSSKMKYLTATQGGGITTLVDKYSAKKWLRAPVDTKQRTLFGTNPEQTVYWKIWCEDQFKGDVAAISFSVTCEYIVKFSDPLQQNSTN